MEYRTLIVYLPEDYRHALTRSFAFTFALVYTFRCKRRARILFDTIVTTKVLRVRVEIDSRGCSLHAQEQELQGREKALRRLEMMEGFTVP